MFYSVSYALLFIQLLQVQSDVTEATLTRDKNFMNEEQLVNDYELREVKLVTLTVQAESLIQRIDELKSQQVEEGERFTEESVIREEWVEMGYVVKSMGEKAWVAISEVEGALAEALKGGLGLNKGVSGRGGGSSRSGDSQLCATALLSVEIECVGEMDAVMGSVLVECMVAEPDR